MKYLLLTAILLTLMGCATAEVPTRLANTYEVTGKVYCDTPIFKNIENMVVRWIQATIAPEWEPVCSNRRSEL